ncbi:mucin-associated surface protein (MASP) [Trypanosoma conorhini]|uniref:Mucin-associated surface protein (MASP) n=1 Tax=Trypanosoma conorhini TaxID=83891 RepID=A0A3R7KIN7_9TRYP|nr:mucin-associated surface protein (MASP) [Trypanosoma conorhini]RNF08353.1 mucin-associated surface protein (MASP) [Trypanosoma conorhini]
MAGRVLLVCALCVLCCAAGVDVGHCTESNWRDLRAARWRELLLWECEYEFRNETDEKKTASIANCKREVEGNISAVFGSAGLESRQDVPPAGHSAAGGGGGGGLTGEAQQRQQEAQLPRATEGQREDVKAPVARPPPPPPAPQRVETAKEAAGRLPGTNGGAAAASGPAQVTSTDGAARPPAQPSAPTRGGANAAGSRGEGHTAGAAEGTPPSQDAAQTKATQPDDSAASQTTGAQETTPTGLVAKSGTATAVDASPPTDEADESGRAAGLQGASDSTEAPAAAGGEVSTTPSATGATATNATKAAPGGSGGDGSTAAFHCASRLAIFLSVACAAAAAMLAA